MSLTRSRALEFLKECKLAAISTVAADGSPEGALINIAVSPDLELIFQTIQTTRKCINLRRDPRVSIVTWRENETLQFEGLADEPNERDLAPLLDLYIESRPEAAAHRGWPGLIYMRVRPKWIRLSYYYGASWRVDELELQSP